MSAPPTLVRPTIAPLGESALLVTLGERVDRETIAHVHGATAAIRAAALPGVSEIVPAYATIAVYFERTRTSQAALAGAITAIVTDALRASPALETARTLAIPTRYDGVDLADVARVTGLDVGEVIERHAARNYVVYALGFAPGFAYLGELDPALVVPRRATPRTRVPAGSVAIAGAQTAVYPSATPGGWHLIGTTSLVMFDAQRSPSALLAVGDEVRFVPLES